MADISRYLENIMAAIYGEEVRGSIHDAIAKINQVSEEAEAAAEGYRDSAKSYAEEAASWSSNPPHIGPNGNWWEYDPVTKEFVDSGTDASISVEFADVTMLAPDAQPRVTNSGTSTDAIFHLFLPRGQAGNGIASIAKTGTSGLVDTYTITYTDSTTATFTVTNGKGIVSVAKTSTSGLTDTYTITYSDSTTSTFEIKNGKDGRSIDTITKTSTSGLTDTYTIAYEDGTSSTFDVVNGNGIVGIEKTGHSGLVDTYTITFTNGTTWNFEVTNGADGTGSVSTVNHILPIGGNVQLDASDVGALPEQSGTPGQVLGFTSVDTIGPVTPVQTMQEFSGLSQVGKLVDAFLAQQAIRETVLQSTLEASKWSNNEYSFETLYPSTSYHLRIDLDADISTTAQKEAYVSAQLCGSKTNKIHCLGEVPSIDIPIVLAVRRKV